MSESDSHKRAKRKAAGKSGKVEQPIGDGQRLDAATKGTATEVQRHESGLRDAAKRLKRAPQKRKVLRTPQPLMEKAVEAMREVGVSGTVSNMKATKKRSVRKRK